MLLLMQVSLIEEGATPAWHESRIVIDDGDTVGAVFAYGGPVRVGDRAPDASGLVRVGTEEVTRHFWDFSLLVAYNLDLFW